MQDPFVAHWTINSLLILLLVMALEHFWALPERYHPLSLFRIMASRLASKVHKPAKNSSAQQRISGGLAGLLLILPLLGLPLVLMQLAEYPQFFDALLLFIALQFSPALSMLKRAHRALAENKKQLARDSITPFLLRETATLSPVGIAKAAIESALLRFMHQYAAVIFYFYLFGGTGALGYRLLYECHQGWNSKLTQYAAFGATAKQAVKLLSLPADIVNALCFALASHINGSWAAFNQASNNKLLAALAGGLQIQLGGPAIYASIKQRTQKVGGSRQVILADMLRCYRAIAMCKVCLLVFWALLSALLYLLANKGYSL